MKPEPDVEATPFDLSWLNLPEADNGVMLTVKSEFDAPRIINTVSTELQKRLDTTLTFEDWLSAQEPEYQQRILSDRGQHV